MPLAERRRHDLHRQRTGGPECHRPDQREQPARAGQQHRSGGQPAHRQRRRRPVTQPGDDRAADEAHGQQAHREQTRVERDRRPLDMQLTLQRSQHRTQPVEQEAQQAQQAVQLPRRSITDERWQRHLERLFV